MRIVVARILIPYLTRGLLPLVLPVRVTLLHPIFVPAQNGRRSFVGHPPTMQRCAPWHDGHFDTGPMVRGSLVGVPPSTRSVAARTFNREW